MISVKKINRFNASVQDRLDEMMLRNRVIKYVPRKKSFWGMVKQWVKSQTKMFVKLTYKNVSETNKYGG
ncbi:MAG TPA: hypothetical protein PK771_13500 [Spirochaetota bacterium]|nr:hypothetical protein [Spirochaetota bacterium]